MNQSPQIAARINQIAKELANGKERGELLVKFGKKWSMSKSSFDRLLKNAKPIAKRLSDLKAKVVNDTITAETKEATRNGLKSKFDRVMILQEEVYRCLNELYEPGTDNFADFGGGRKNVKKQLTVIEKVKLRQVINQMQSEISKIEGDYAPDKVAQTDTQGNDIKRLSDDELAQKIEKIERALAK